MTPATVYADAVTMALVEWLLAGKDKQALAGIADKHGVEPYHVHDLFIDHNAD
jgi:methylphosphotriester-DNA--protein-cysteine methyltransferase